MAEANGSADPKYDDELREPTKHAQALRVDAC